MSIPRIRKQTNSMNTNFSTNYLISWHFYFYTIFVYKMCPCPYTSEDILSVIVASVVVTIVIVGLTLITVWFLWKRNIINIGMFVKFTCLLILKDWSKIVLSSMDTKWPIYLFQWYLDYIIGNKRPTASGKVSKSNLEKNGNSESSHQFAFDNLYFREDDELDSSPTTCVEHDNSKVHGMLNLN